MEPNPPSERFRELAARLRSGARGVPLADAALVLAGEFQPELDPAPSLRALARLAEEACAVVPTRGALAERVDALVDFMHGVAGFRGNADQYDDPRNSFLNEVLARRTGIPITLAIVYADVAARVGLELQGVSFPGHFLLRTPGEPPLVLDAFHGARLDERACAARLRQALGEDAVFGPERLAPARASEVVVRMLGNLKHGYATRAEWLRALDCVDRILLVTPGAPGELRDRGLLWEQLECFGSALGDLERFLALAPGAPEAGAIQLGSQLGPDKRVLSAAESFAPNDTIYASIATEGEAQGVVLAARWSYEDGQTVAESSETVARAGPTVVEFHVAKPDGWPAGRYRIDVTANGRPAGTREFEVR